MISWCENSLRLFRETFHGVPELGLGGAAQHILAFGKGTYGDAAGNAINITVPSLRHNSLISQKLGKQHRGRTQQPDKSSRIAGANACQDI